MYGALEWRHIKSAAVPYLCGWVWVGVGVGVGVGVFSVQSCEDFTWWIYETTKVLEWFEGVLQ